MKITVTTSSGLESILKKEIQRIWGNIIESKDRIITFEWDEKALYDINIWSRVWNKVYINAIEWDVYSFDDLFDLIQKVDFGKYFLKGSKITIKAKSIKSVLESTQAIQSITKKSMSEKIAGKGNFMRENFWDFEVFVLIQNNVAKILINTSWEALHKRWYRKFASDAPLKESLAAGIILLSGWKFKENLLDPFCGSGTMLIEAWMIAKNIAPGSLWREFLFEEMAFFDENIFEERITEAKNKVFAWEYKIKWSDIDEDVIDIAKNNIENAWLWDIITVEHKDALDYLNEEISWTIVTNPPYGERIWEDVAEELHIALNKIWDKNPELNLNIFTGYENANRILKNTKYKLRKLYNWSILCNIYKKK